MVNIIQDNKANIILNTYALARASWIEDDFVSSFVPMAASVINQQGYETIKVDVFTSDFEDEYGIQLPSQPAIKLLSILQKKGFITFDEGLRLWKPNIENISKIDLTKKRLYYKAKLKMFIKSLFLMQKKNLMKR